MWSDMQVQGALSGFKAIGSYIVSSREYKSKKAWQAYNNAMTRLQNAQNQNNLTYNEGQLIERKVRESYALRVSEYKTAASATVAAAAVGAEGNSVDMVLLDIGRNEARAQNELRTDFNYQVQGIRNQQQASNLQTEMQIDHTFIPKPNIAQSLLGWAGDVTLAKFQRDTSDKSARI